VDELCQSMRAGPSRSAFRSRSQTTSKLLRSKSVVVSVGGKARGKLVQVSIRETNESEPFDDASLRSQGLSKPEAGIGFWDESARCLVTEQVATGV
jgi:hypothetical protein